MGSQAPNGGGGFGQKIAVLVEPIGVLNAGTANAMLKPWPAVDAEDLARAVYIVRGSRVESVTG